ncbi:MAG: DUF411 domain-containing protein [Vicinamibacterales bacterium]
MHRRLLALATAAVMTLGVTAHLVAQRAAVTAPTVTLYKSATCGCCAKWADHLAANGFKVETKVVSDERLYGISREAGVPEALSSCHTAEVDGYTIEGHVPAMDIHRLLRDRPKNVRGLAVPGMPIGSPGMEMGDRQDPYQVLAFTWDKTYTVFARHP